MRVDFKSKHFFFIISVLVLFNTIFFQNCAKYSAQKTNDLFSSSSSQAGAASLAGASVDDLRLAYRKASLIITEKSPSQPQLDKIKSSTDYVEAINSLINSEDFLGVVHNYHQSYFELSGLEEGVNMNEAANLATYLIKNNFDFRRILTETDCINDTLTPVACSSFPKKEDQQTQAAGVLTTQGFLKKWVSAFNFRRTNHVLKAFACHGYPDESDPGIAATDIEDRLAPFNSTTLTPVCYSCHRTLNPRASLFFNFDVSGQFNLNPSKELSTKNASGDPATVQDILKPGVKPVFQGKVVANLREYGKALSESDKFSNCVALRFTNFALGRAFDDSLPREFQFVFSEIKTKKFNIKSFLSSVLTSQSFVSQASQL